MKTEQIKQVTSDMFRWIKRNLHFIFLGVALLFFGGCFSYIVKTETKREECKTIARHFEAGVVWDDRIGGCIKVARDGTINTYTYENGVLAVKAQKIKITFE